MSKAEATFEDIQGMLLKGGYFRAKLTSFLTEFDIIAGGLSWGIRGSRFAIDVEFVEDAAIRHKIRIAENICKALKQMDCPQELLPHQIQGLDFGTLRIVFTWLLRRVAATREENAYFVRQHTKLQFQRFFGATLFDPMKRVADAGPSITGNTHVEPAPTHQVERFHLNTLLKYGGAKAPPRVMTASARTTFANRAEHATSVLLEFGDRYIVSEAAVHRDDDDGDDVAARERAAQEEQEERERAMVDRIAATMSAHHGKDKLSAAGLTSVLATTDQSKLTRLRAQYQARREELEAQLAAEEAERGRLERRAAKLAELEAELDTLKQKLKKSKSQAAKAAAAAAEVQSSFEAEGQSIAELETAVATAESEARQNPEVNAALDTLIAKREEVTALNAEIDRATAERAEALQELKAEVQRMQERVAEGSDAAAVGSAETERLTALRARLEADLQTVEAANLDLQRKIDTYPTRLELLQYQARVTELDEEIAWKYEETKLAFYRYNTHVEVLRCVENELEIFTTVQKSYDACEPERSGKITKDVIAARDDFIEDVSRFAKQLSSAKDTQAEKLREEDAALKQRTTECAGLVARQQDVQSRLAAMKEAVEKHSRLTAQLRELEEATAEAQDAAEVDGA